MDILGKEGRNVGGRKQKSEWWRGRRGVRMPLVFTAQIVV